MAVWFGYLLAFGMGGTLGVLGAGGSILAVPILVYFFNVAPVTATAYSLLIVGMTALIGGIRYYQQGSVDFRTGGLFALPAIAGVYWSRAYLVPALPDPILQTQRFLLTKDSFILLLFSCLMYVAALMMIRRSTQQVKSKKMKSRWRPVIIIIEGLVVGVLTGVVGAGGGFLIIPALVLLAGLEMRVAVGSSLLIIACKSLLGFIGDVQSGLVVDKTLIATFMTCTITGMILATHFAEKIDEAQLKKGFGYFMLVIATAIFFKEI